MTEKGPVSWVCFKTHHQPQYVYWVAKSPETSERERGRYCRRYGPALQKPECEHEAEIDMMRY